MKKTTLFAALMVAVGFTAAAPGSQSFFQDDFFSDSGEEASNSGLSFEEDDFFDDSGEDSENEEESSSSDSFLEDDDFFDEEDSEETEDSENSDDSNDDVGICVIGEDSPCNSEEYDGDNQDSDESDSDESDSDETVVEERSVTPAPEPSYVGEDYLSYPNPRDHFLHNQGIHREGSLKVCKILLNQNGEVIEGDTVDATFNVDTENVPYSDAETISFDTPIDQVADLVGTSEELIEGDGYLDAECAEYHDLRLNETYTYSQEEITGEDADEVETVGYIEKWENRNTPIGNVENYGESEDSDGTIRLEPGYNGRHAEVIIVNQINR